MKAKQKYNVYLRRIGTDVYDCGDLRYFVGSTYAVSDKQAVNNVRFRNDGKMPNCVTIDDYAEEGTAFIEYIAIPTEQEKY